MNAILHGMRCFDLGGRSYFGCMQTRIPCLSKSSEFVLYQHLYDIRTGIHFFCNNSRANQICTVQVNAFFEHRLTNHRLQTNWSPHRWPEYQLHVLYITEERTCEVSFAQNFCKSTDECVCSRSHTSLLLRLLATSVCIRWARIIYMIRFKLFTHFNLRRVVMSVSSSFFFFW